MYAAVTANVWLIYASVHIRKAHWFSLIQVINLIKSNSCPIVMRIWNDDLRFCSFTSAAAFMLQRAASFDFSYQTSLHNFYLAFLVDLWSFMDFWWASFEKMKKMCELSQNLIFCSSVLKSENTAWAVWLSEIVMLLIFISNLV